MLAFGLKGAFRYTDCRSDVGRHDLLHKTNMKLQRFGIVLFLSVGFVLANFTDSKSVGFSVATVDRDSLVQAGSSPWMLLWAAMAVVLIFFTMTRTSPNEVVGMPSWGRRFTAFVIDFVAVTLAMAPFAALIPLAAEWLRSGHFAWSFQRRYTIDSDFYLGVPLVFIMMGLLAVYFAWPIARGKQTLGCYTLRLKVTPDESIRRRFGLSQGLWRVFLGFIGLCSWPFIWLLGRGKDGSTWYDRSTNCHVELVRYT